MSQMLAFVFPGQGSQSLGMLADLAAATLSAGMAVYGISSVLFVRYTPWGVERA